MPSLSNENFETLMFKFSLNPEKIKGIKPFVIFLKDIEQNHYGLVEGDSIIINLSSSNNTGSHFISLYIPSKTQAEYFDSFALPSFDSNINKAMQAANLKVTEFKTPIQDFSSQFCGLYCSKYIYGSYH